jgi:hypothetical protein
MPANATLPELTQRFHHQQLRATQFCLRPQDGRLFLRPLSGRLELRPPSGRLHSRRSSSRLSQS